MAIQAENSEIFQFIENKKLMGKGLGFVDIHLFVASILSNVKFWTLDKRLNEISKKYKMAMI